MWSFLPILMLMVVFSPLAIDIFLPSLPDMANDFQSDLTLLQWSISGFLLAMGIGQLFAGPVADKYGRKPVALFGIVIYFLACLACVVANTIELHLLSRFIHGLGTCAIVVSAFAIVRDKYDARQSGMMYSYLNGVICCIPALAPILGGWLASEYGWQSTFMFMAAYAVGAGTLVAVFLKETNTTKDASSVKLLHFNRYTSIALNRVFQFHSLAVLVAMAVIIAYVSSAPAWLMVELGLSSQMFIFWFSLNAIFNIAACVLAPKCLKVFGVVNTISAGFITLLAGGLLMVAMQDLHTPVAFMLPIMLSSIGFSLLMGTCAGQALAPFGEKAGTASALLGFLQMAGSAVLVGIVQQIPVSVPMQVALLMLSFVVFALIWFWPGSRVRAVAEA
ncbi:multidrug effflux MFS transporter [Thalassotalea sp. Y01]|uniref:multidrug effflux MFS transporter n=1 Tax=Thalassotalea sp. Y01 TaxID=2729613 RepID=UPI00145E94E2|nr:multidrug effflux MFS transporter [Thalassotalea sp. Y01]NMP15394.1 multidrug effflux MFS transporter [Thalassotalea sp. Y01]